ncbi:MAG TPA: NAD-dependent epimerase/dehydratase family protein [Verrucomicrobiae bacterium]|nr:NAD-dependent epimerase/dehydratase family protein [Verrucomicrobiae bacterium]
MIAGTQALITGGSGYFGSLLRDRLRAHGQKVRIFDLSDADDRAGDIDFVKGDIRNEAQVRQACAGCDVIYHCVAQVPLAKDKHLFESVNIQGTENLLQAALDAKARKVIYVSSSAVFGVPKSNPVTETTTPTPAEAYGRAKLEGEHLCAKYAKQGLDVTIIRPRTIMGHGRLGIFQILFEWIRTGYNVPVLGSGENLYQFVHADDLAEACVLAAARPGTEIYNCGAERFGSMRSVLEHLCAHAKTGSKVKSVPMAPAVAFMNLTSALGLSPLGPYHAMMYGRSLYFDITKAKNELGWRPRFSSNEMFAQSYDCM